jgi:predicted amidohydrolase YtcJ
MGLLRLPDPTPEQLEIAILTAQRHQLSLGITSATDPLLTPLHVRVYRALEAGQKLLLRTNGMPIRRPDGGSETLPLPEKYVSDWLRLDTVKFFADGGLSGATAAVSQPYKITGSRGVLRFDTAELAALMQEAHDAGFRIGTHAIGDTAIEQVLGVYEGLYARAPNAAPRHRIEHLGLPTADHLRRCAALRLIAVPQTVFLPALGAAFRRYLPDDNLARCYPVRAMLEAGLTVALSSDAPVVPDDNPLLGIKAALDRRGPDGQPIAPDQTISAAEAVRAYTLGGALASGDAANRGSIRAGKWADWVELDGDPLAAPPEALLSIRVARTWIAGEAVYTG